MPATHRLEKRASQLAGRMRSISDGLRTQLAEPGDRPPFTTALTQRAALDWWAQHRHDQYGAELLRGMTPPQIADLDASLYAYVNQPQEATNATTAG